MNFFIFIIERDDLTGEQDYYEVFFIIFLTKILSQLCLDKKKNSHILGLQRLP